MSTPLERLFSIAGYQVWDRRSPEKVNQVNFIVENEDL
jgi:hypothetical protein